MTTTTDLDTIETKAQLIEDLADQHYNLIERSAKIRLTGLALAVAVIVLTPVTLVLNSRSAADPTNDGLWLWLLGTFAFMWVCGFAMLATVFIDRSTWKQIRHVRDRQAETFTR